MGIVKKYKNGVLRKYILKNITYPLEYSMMYLGHTV